MQGQNEDEAEKDASDALEAFFGQFGEIDAHASIVLEEFFKGLMGEKE
jgi:hypothetical protein